jgi:anti-sigma factor RsiW
MTTPAPDHATHDPLLIAADLDGTLDARDTGRVQDWLAACSTCATLRSDFETLAVATRMLPTPPRPRDFSLTESDAERVRGRSWGLRRALAAFDSPRASFTRPLAVGLTTMGLAGLLIANIPSVALFGAAGAAPMAAQIEMSTDVAAPALLAPAASAVPAAGAPGSPAAIPGTAASPEADIAGEVAPGASAASRDAYANSGASPGGDSAKATATDEYSGSDPVGGPAFLVLASVALLLSGLSLALLRWWARRLSDA